MKDKSKQSRNFPEVIFEIANSHDGDKTKLNKIIDTVSKIEYSNKSIKFQIFSPTGIADKDYEWFPVYKKICFSADFWTETLKNTKLNIQKIWVDVFDTFGASVIKKNLKFIYGIKLQASTLDNQELYDSLRSINFEGKILMLNVSGFSIKKIKALLRSYEGLKFKKIILQIGFQNYPTKVEHTGLQKISFLKNEFANDICVADHIDGSKIESLSIPILAYASGANMIEKHICLKREDTKYDYFSSVEPDEVKDMLKNLLNYHNASNGPFIQKKEAEYLKKSIQIPILKRDLYAGDIISKKYLSFKRTNKKGLSFDEIQQINKNSKVLKTDITKGNAIQKNNFKKANIGVIVAGRMKSSRLKKKALLKIQGKESVRLCLESCLKIKEAQKIVLATSTNKQDAILEMFLPSNRKIHFFRGHPSNVIKRYVDASLINNIDVIIRVTADCPFVSSEIASLLLESHFKEGADYTAAKNFSVGTSCEIINLSALKKVQSYFKNAKYSEYMTWYFQNNPHIFNLNIVKLPEELVRNYRLTLDYDEDLKMFNKLVESIGHHNLNTKKIFSFLDKSPEISQINSKSVLTYKTDKNLIRTLNKNTKIKNNK